jgi:hypothetical protein
MIIMCKGEGNLSQRKFQETKNTPWLLCLNESVKKLQKYEMNYLTRTTRKGGLVQPYGLMIKISGE